MKGLVRLEIHPERVDSRKLGRAVDVLRKGGVAAYPTDTVYALGCLASSKKAIESIRRARRMRDSHRMSIILPDVATAATFGHFSTSAFRLARRVLPGPYTFILPAMRNAPREVIDKKRRHVGIRVPDSGIARTLADLVGEPLLTSSAVPPDAELACRDADEIVDEFGAIVDVIIDGGDTPGEMSTVLSFDGDGQVEVVREGLGPVDFL